MKLLPLALLAAFAAAPTHTDDELALRGRTLEEWRALIEPSATELGFEEIPWRASFWSAVEEAQAADRPVLLWAMNGHPLGCT